jgi:hypothetical protein
MCQTGGRSRTQAAAPAQQWQAEWLMDRPNAAAADEGTATLAATRRKLGDFADRNTRLATNAVRELSDCFVMGYRDLKENWFLLFSN